MVHREQWDAFGRVQRAMVRNANGTNTRARWGEMELGRAGWDSVVLLRKDSQRSKPRRRETGEEPPR